MQGGQGSMADTAEVQLRADHVFLSNPGYWGLLVCSWYISNQSVPPHFGWAHFFA
jgi:hypothetical protein